MQTDNLKELRSLRIQEKAIKARIDAISDAATDEALALAPNGGEFTIPDVGKFQLQINGVLRSGGFPQVQRTRGGQMARERPRENQGAEPRQSPHRPHGWPRQDLRPTLSRQRTRRDQDDGKSDRIDLFG